MGIPAKLLPDKCGEGGRPEERQPPSPQFIEGIGEGVFFIL
jgi:hypothetical protein